MKRAAIALFSTASLVASPIVYTPPLHGDYATARVSRIYDAALAGFTPTPVAVYSTADGITWSPSTSAASFGQIRFVPALKVGLYCQVSANALWTPCTSTGGGGGAGPAGPTGPQGATGQAGPQGPAGPAGGGATTDASQLTSGTMNNARLPPALSVNSVSAQSFINNSPYNNHIDLTYTGTPDPAAVAVNTVRLGVAAAVNSPYILNLPVLPAAGVLTSTLNSNGDVVSVFAAPTLPQFNAVPLTMKNGTAPTGNNAYSDPPDAPVFTMRYTNASGVEQSCLISVHTHFDPTYTQGNLQFVSTCPNAQLQMQGFNAGIQMQGPLNGFATMNNAANNFYADPYGRLKLNYLISNQANPTVGASCDTADEWVLGRGGAIFYCNVNVWSAK